MSTNTDFFPGISRIPYVPDGCARDVLCFKYYNASEIVLSRTMEDWLRFSVCYWHSFCGTGADPFGAPTLRWPWNEGDNDMEIAKKRLSAAFEFFTKLGVKKKNDLKIFLSFVVCPLYYIPEYSKL